MNIYSLKHLSSLLLAVSLFTLACFIFQGSTRNDGGVISSDLLTTVGGDHAGHDHGVEVEAYTGPQDSIKLSKQALKNIRFEPHTISLSTYVESIRIPAEIIERPGRSQVTVSAPMTGVITKVYHVLGEAVRPGQSLFEIRLTHEDLVTAQRDFLQSVEERDVVQKQLRYLKSLGEGVIAGKRLLERQYELEKLAAMIRSQEQGLLLHGLSVEQVKEITTTRSLLKTFLVRVPGLVEGTKNEIEGFNLQKLFIQVGQSVEAGAPLCELGDHHQLYIQGQAFADDADRLHTAAVQKWGISCREANQRKPHTITGLQIEFIDNHIDINSQLLKFYLPLQNKVQRDVRLENKRYIEWRYKPGQRVEILLPIKNYKKQIVVPVDAVATEGAEAYVFVQNGDHFDRTPVHIKYRSREQIVLDADGTLFPGDIIAARGAYQLHLQIKNRSGGAPDPHAGHNHG